MAISFYVVITRNNSSTYLFSNIFNNINREGIQLKIYLQCSSIGPLQLGSRDQIFPRKFSYYGL